MRILLKHIWAPILFIVFFVVSCKKDGNSTNLGKAEITVKVSGSEFNDPKIKGKFSRLDKGHSSESPEVQMHAIALDEDHTLWVELKPNYPTLSEKKQNLKASNKADIKQDVQSGVKYKVVVFTDNGNYVTERDYVRDQESATEPLRLEGGKTYSFIVYSINSTSDNPNITFSDPENKTLATASLTSIAGDSDFMYFRKDMQVSSDSDNFLGVVFQHKFSQIITTISSNAVNSNVMEVEATFDSHFPTADIQLSDADITRTGTAGSTSLTFTDLDSQAAKATNILNGNTTSASLNISKLVVGSTTRNNLPALTVSITPGVSYNLNLNVTPKDGDLVYLGVFSVKLNGMIWMDRNLGADSDIDPDQNPTVQSLIGNYYQFGLQQAVAASNTAAGAIDPWKTYGEPDGSWNGGTERRPETVSGKDPCPTGFRVPTRLEFETLLNSTTASNIGSWATSNNANTIGAAKILTSKSDPNVKMTFPAAGYRNAMNGILYWRGGTGEYWTSATTDNDLIRYRFTEQDNGIFTTNGGEPENLGKCSGFTVRCIADQK